MEEGENAQNQLPQLQGSVNLNKLLKWEDMALSSLLAVLVKWSNCDNFQLEVISRPSVATRIWFTLSFELPEWKYDHVSRRRRICSASSPELLKDRLIKCLDREQISKTRLGINEVEETDEA